MADACCGPDEHGGAENAGEVEAQERLWQVRELQAAAASGLLLLSAWLVADGVVDGRLVVVPDAAHLAAAQQPQAVAAAILEHLGATS